MPLGPLRQFESFHAQSSARMPDRRQVLKAAAWSAPVLLLAVATPAAAASQILPGAPTVTAGMLVNSHSLADRPGPLSWSGGKITAPDLSLTSPGVVSVTYTYTVLLSGPGLASYSLGTGSVVLTSGQSHDLAAAAWTPPALPGVQKGVYTVTVAALREGVSTLAQTSADLQWIDAVLTATQAQNKNKNAVKLTLTGPAGVAVSFKINTNLGNKWVRETADPSPATTPTPTGGKLLGYGNHHSGTVTVIDFSATSAAFPVLKVFPATVVATMPDGA